MPLRKALAALTATLSLVAVTAAPANADTPPAITGPAITGPTPPATLPDGTLAANPVRTAPDTAATSAVDIPKGNVTAVQKAPRTRRSNATSLDSMSPYYYYAGGRQNVAVDGIGVNMTVDHPYLYPGDGHTLGEVALIAGGSPNRQIVEVGWTVADPNNNEPRLFVYHWVNGQESCYNGCGFVNYGGATTNPGDQLPAGVVKKFDIQYAEGAWWIAYDNSWVGYFPEQLWKDEGVASFATTTQVQLFGEVAGTDAHPYPCSDMGSGQLPSGTKPARFSSTTYRVGGVNQGGSAVKLEAFQSGYADTTGKYEASAASGQAVYWGGGGYC